MHTIPQLAAVFCQSENKIQAALYAAGFSPADYGDDGCTSLYGQDAAEYLAEFFPLPEAAPPADDSTATAPAAILPRTCKTVQSPGGAWRCQL